MQAIIGKQFPKILIPKINDAKTSIKIVVFDWRWYSNDPANPVQLFNQSIVRAVGRGVVVSAIVNSDSIVGILTAVRVNAKKINTKGLVHAKMIIIDDKIVVVGSHNYSTMAFTQNHEISSLFEDAEIAKEYLLFFNDLWQL